jgi:uncharacterized protein (DUF1684 family)
MEISKWREEILNERKQKDIFFSIQYNSPIPYEKRQQFKGLDYYPPDPDFQFKLELHEHEEKKILKIQDTQGNERKFLRWGEFRFKIGDKEYKLQAYKSNPQENRLFVPFRDETSGKETYGAGRYIDLNNEEHYTAEGKWILDFNKAYNPWCAYSESYACPFVDPENWLEAPVPASEKAYHLKKEA